MMTDDEKDKLKKKKKKKNFCAKITGSLDKTCFGKCMSRIKAGFVKSLLISSIIKHYNGIYSGVPILTISILNLFIIPELNFYDAHPDRKLSFDSIELIIISQLAINFIYLADFVCMLMIFGAKMTVFKKTWALRLEIVFQALYIYNIPAIKNIYDEDSSIEEKASLSDLIQGVILFRLLRIFSFLSELEQWTFFMKAIKVMRGPFFNLVFTLYSLYFVYTLIGMELFGGKINSESFKYMYELNPDAEIGHDYIWLNFNDFASGLITLFSMMLFNNW